MARPKKSTIELKSLDECTKAMADLLVATTDIETLTAERDRAVAAQTSAEEQSGARVARPVSSS
jgi:uncharacterized protein YdeI (YjbR/CyaY-like superfamily)